MLSYQCNSCGATWTVNMLCVSCPFCWDGPHRQTVGHKPVEYNKSQHAIKHETYRVVADSETEGGK
jgi:hypothetical protein